MTYEEKLYSMRGAELIQEAEKVGAKIVHKGTALKESKEKAIAKILAVVTSEEAPAEPEKVETTIETPETETTPSAEEKEKKLRFSKAFLEEVLEYLNTLEKVEAGVWPNTKNLIWVKVPAVSKKGKILMTRKIEIRVGKNNYAVASDKTEALAEKVIKSTKYYLSENYGKFTFDNDFYKTVVNTFLS